MEMKKLFLKTTKTTKTTKIVRAMKTNLFRGGSVVFRRNVNVSLSLSLLLVSLVSLVGVDLARAQSFPPFALNARCEERVGVSSFVRITVFYFDNDTLEKSRRIRYESLVAPDLSKQPLRSVSNGNGNGNGTTSTSSQPREVDYYDVVAVETTNPSHVLFRLNGGGELIVERASNGFQVSTRVFFTRPFGPEISRIFENCEVSKPEVGATAHN